jgi:hypothetical protein
MYGTPTYSSWAAMIGRVSGKKSSAAHYVGRGITVCDRWRDFAAFFADMGARPDGMTLDRYPNRAGNYEPGNCRWATRQQQAENRSCTVLVQIGGEALTTSEWSRRTGINEGTLRRRIKAGWPEDQLLDPRDFHFRSGRWADGENPQRKGEPRPRR